MLLTKLPATCRAALLTLAIVLSLCFVNAQSRNDSIINIAAVQSNCLLSPSQYQAVMSNRLLANINDIPALDYGSAKTAIPAAGKLRKNNNSRYIYIKLLLVNRSTTAQTAYLYPGYYFKTIELYRENDAGTGLVVITEDPVDAAGYRRIEMTGGDSATYYVLLRPVKIQVNTFRPEMVHTSFLHLHFNASRNNNEALNIFTFILVGILCMMIIFSFSNYLFNHKKEFLYYGMYALANAIVLFLKAQLYLSVSRFNVLFEEYLDFMLLLTGLIFYMAFLKKFLSISPNRYPLLHKMIYGIEIFIILSAIGYSALYFLTDNLAGLELIEMGLKYIIIAAGAVLIVMGLRQRNKLMNYIVLGNACVIIFGFISMTITLSSGLQNTMLSHALFYYELGIIGEFSFFLLGLTYKNRMELINRIKRENAALKSDEKLAYEKQLAVMKTNEDERNRISADMHDELGGGMTAIRLLSELAKQRTNPEALPEIEKISVSANDLLGKMNAIIWSMKVSHDWLDSLVDYIKSFTHEFFDNNDIRYTIEAPEQMPAVKMPGIRRRNIFLSYKEIAMMLRATRAVSVTVRLMIEPATFTIRIDYEGMQGSSIPESTRNIVRKRMHLINGRLVESGSGGHMMLEIDI